MCVTFNHKQDLKTRKTRKCHHFQIQKDIVTSTAVKVTKLKKRTEIQDALPKVRWGELEADNTWRFRYLGSIFEAGGGQMTDVERRVSMTAQRFGKIGKCDISL